MGTMKFNGVTILESDIGNVYSEDSKIEGVVIQTPPIYEFPARRMNTIQIQGRNGDIIIDKNSYNNVLREYNIAASLKTGVTFIQKVRELVDWLSSTNGYARLEDSYEPDYFRLAMYRSGGQLPNFYDKATAMVLKFECKPQRFLKTGENLITEMSVGVPITNDTWFNVINPTKYIALPEIIISGEAVKIEFKAGTITEPTGDVISDFLINGVTDNAIIDSDLQDCYDDEAYLNNDAIVTGGFPKLYPGNNWIKVTATAFTSMSIKPRWWVL